ncbi:MAG: protein-glutamate O-methyltransferase CheR [Myxococcales bacterium]|nr:protein-glutamate O-methyltransferase CheR [Myxococcales bacterium]
MPLLFDRGPSLRLEDFRLLRDLINRFCGIHFGEDAIYVLERRLRERLAELGFFDFAQYYQHLRYHPEGSKELEHAVEILTTNETYFFREHYQLEAFCKEVLPELKARAERRGTRRLALWSAGCSTGEEVYTLAILAVDSGLFSGWDLRVFGNDISRQVLQKARRGVYGPSSFRTMPERYYSYFVEAPGGHRVHPHIRSMCHFGHLNLLEHGRTAIVGRVDATFCRNVMIYFDPESRRRVIRTFYDRLIPGGYLLLGHSESLLNVSTDFELVHLSSDMVYRRADPRADASGAP